MKTDLPLSQSSSNLALPFQTACESGRYDVAAEAFGKSFDVMASVPVTRDNAKDLESAKEEMDIKKKVVTYFLEVQR